MKIAILGYGVVGSGVDEILKQAKAQALGIECIAILEREHKLHLDSRMISDYKRIMADKTIEVVVETLGGIHPAYEYIKEALINKKSVVTANKAVVARYFKEFNLLALENNVYFNYEASVGGVLPIIKLLHDVSRIDEIKSVSGILNGTSNYILSMMHQQGLDMIEALGQAQALGYAERDPSADIEGYDVRNKMMIVASIAFNSVCDMDKIITLGIQDITAADIKYFKAKGLVCKLFGCAKRQVSTYSITIMPTLFLANDCVATIDTNFNIASFYSETSQTISVIGQGAGHFPTAHSIVEDLVDIKEQRKVAKAIIKDNLSFSIGEALDSYILRSSIVPPNYTKAEDNYYYYENISVLKMLKVYENIKFSNPGTVLFALSKAVQERGI